MTIVDRILLHLTLAADYPTPVRELAALTGVDPAVIPAPPWRLAKAYRVLPPVPTTPETPHA